MPLTTRPLTRDDLDKSDALIDEAFGEPPSGTTPQSADDPPRPGYHAFGTFDDDHLVARLATRGYHSWFGGSAIASGGIAGVVVTAERRGTKLLDELFRVALDDGLRERGEAVSTMFCTAPGIYRKFGYEVISSYDTVEVPAAALARIGAPAGVRTRSAGFTTPGRQRRTARSRAAARRSQPMPRLTSTRSPESRSRSTTRAT